MSKTTYKNIYASYRDELWAKKSVIEGSTRKELIAGTVTPDAPARKFTKGNDETVPELEVSTVEDLIAYANTPRVALPWGSSEAGRCRH